MNRTDPEFINFQLSHPSYQAAIERVAFARLAQGAKRISMKASSKSYGQGCVI